MPEVMPAAGKQFSAGYAAALLRSALRGQPIRLLAVVSKAATGASKSNDAGSGTGAAVMFADTWNVK